MDTLQLLLDVEDATVEVDVAPPQPEHLAAAHTVGQDHQVGAVPAVAAGRTQEGRGLLRRPRSYRLPVIGGYLDEFGDVAQHQFFAFGATERRAQHRPGAMERPDRSSCRKLVVQEPLNVPDFQDGQWEMPYLRHDVQPDSSFVEFGGADAVLGGDHAV